MTIIDISRQEGYCRIAIPPVILDEVCEKYPMTQDLAFWSLQHCQLIGGKDALGEALRLVTMQCIINRIFSSTRDKLSNVSWQDVFPFLKVSFNVIFFSIALELGRNLQMQEQVINAKYATLAIF